MIIKVKNISFIDYFNLENKTKYNYYLRYAELVPTDLFKIGSLMDQSFGFVKDVQDLFYTSGLTWEKYFELIVELKGLKKETIANNKLFQLHASRLYLKEQIEQITELERSNLGHASNAKEQMAGIEVFDKYGAFLQFDSLANGDVTKIKEIEKLDYSVCFAKLKLESDSSKFQIELNKLNK